MSNYLFTLTITPVQSFITQARKTKDLFVGSEILSSLMRETIKKIENYQEVEIIFPQNREFVSNKFVAKLENKTEDKLKEIGESLEKKINKDFLMMIFESTCKYNSSLENFFKVYWVAVELTDESSETYIETYKKLEQNLGAIKNLRDFKQEYQAEGKSKCSLCGERNFEEISDEDKLCLVCLTKRCDLVDNLHKKYLTISDIVMFDRLEKLDGQDAHTYLKNNPSEKKYYALIQFDIDSLGKTLSSLDEDGQKILSKQLGEFGKKAKGIVDKSGQTIYAGGDDFLGFVNLSYLFDVIIEIQKAFEEKVKNEFSNLTYSTSIIIAHYKAPLNKILYYSRKTLEETKNRFKNPPKAFDLSKNSIAITYVTKSNNLSTSYFYKDRVDTFILLHKLLQDKESPKLSSKFIFNMAQEFRGFDLDKESMSIDEIDLIIDMMNVELKRLLKRASADFDRDKNEKKEQLQKLYSGLSEFIYDNWIEETQKFDFENYMMFFKVAEAMNGER
jgi:CRISPR-associated protein Cmr2